MHALPHDITAAIVVIGIVIGIVRIAPIAIVVGTDEASGKEMAAVVEAMVEAIVSETTGVTRSEAVTLEAVAPHGSNPDVAGWRMRKTVAKIAAAANSSCCETTAAKTTRVRGEAATATESAGVTAAESTTSPAVAATTSASASSGQSHIGRQCCN